MTPDPADLGRLRRLARIADRDGLVRAAAIDHPENYDLLFDRDLSRVDFAEVVESKLELIAAMAPHASALLLDPRASIGQAIITGAAPGNVGIISGLENLYYEPSTGGFEPRLETKPGWTPAKLSLLGVDAAKLVVFHRGTDTESEQAKVDLVRQVAADCHARQLPLIVEPLWYAAPGESLDDPQVRARRTASVIATAATFKEAGADIMKVEFPVDLRTDAASADEACAQLAQAVSGPWVLLSAGVTFEGFCEQLVVGARHGACGFMAGRAIWGDAVGRHDAAVRAAGARQAQERLDRLTEILHTSPNRLWDGLPTTSAAATVGPTWFREGFGD